MSAHSPATMSKTVAFKQDSNSRSPNRLLHICHRLWLTTYTLKTWQRRISKVFSGYEFVAMRT